MRPFYLFALLTVMVAFSTMAFAEPYSTDCGVTLGNLSNE